MWKILIVDDSMANRNLLANTLKNRASCDLAEDGNAAIQAHKSSIDQGAGYDAVLLDIQMPNVDGMQVLKSIRETEAGLGIAPQNFTNVIMVTASKDPWIEAFNRGCDDYILKPIDPDQLIEKLESKIKS